MVRDRNLGANALAVRAIAVGMNSDSEMPMAARSQRSSAPERAKPVITVTKLQMIRLKTTKMRLETRSPMMPETGQPKAYTHRK